MRGSAVSARLPGASAVARSVIGILATLSAAGCSPASLLNALAWRNGVEATRSVPYGEGPRQTLDVYRPRNAAGAPVIVFFYGGTWQGGDKRTYRFVAAALASRGFVAIVPDYRVYPDVRYAGFLEDGARAVAWAKDNAVRFGGDPGKLFLMGHSAGAYIAAMLALDGRWLDAEGLVPERDVAGLIGLAGPYDFLPLRDAALKAIFGGPDRSETQPISHVSGDEPPAFLATGTTDRRVDPGNANRLAQRMEAAGGSATTIRYRGIGHLGIVAALAFPLRFLAPVLRDVQVFIERTTR